ncbi:MAG: beta-lactamase family protein [Hyphomicrobiales bacterium]|nr:beta-lactamase family protein [Hyphomicrobiales bacterium]
MSLAVEKPETVGMSASRLERIAPAMQAHVDRGTYAGITTLIARRGKIVHARQFGWRDKEAQAPMTDDAIFRLYSMTKPIVCVGLMTLWEEGRCTLFDPLAKYIPSFGRVKAMGDDGALTDPVRPILIGDLMAHTSGLSYHFLEDFSVSRMYAKGELLKADSSLEEGIEDLARFPLAFQPGSRWHYSVGIDVAARVIEVVSGKPLGVFLHERLFEPLRMRDAGFGVAPERRAAVAAMYGRPDLLSPDATHRQAFADWGKGVNDRLDVSLTYPVDKPDRFVRGGHGLFSTASDYYRFAQMLANGGELEGVRVIGRKTLELMHSNRLPASMLPIEIGGLPLPGNGFGLGSRVLIDPAPAGTPASAGAFGWAGAAKTFYWVDPREEMVGLFMTQSMMSFDLPELELQALAYQAIEA